MVTVIVLIAGVFGLRSMKRETFPPVDFARVLVTTIYPGASAEEVEEKITNLIEDELRGLKGVRDVRSTSQPERSSIDVRIDLDYTTKEVVDEIRRGVQRASSRLPVDVLDDPLVTESNAEEIPVIELALVGPNENRARDLQADLLKRKLEDIRGVKDVRLTGYRERELQVLLNPNKMRENYIGIPLIVETIRNHVKNVPAGYLRDGSEITLVRILGQTKDPELLGNVIIRANDSGQLIRIRDVARVQLGSEEPSVLTRVNGQPATLLTVQKKGDADSLAIVQQVNQSLSEFSKQLPPEQQLVIYNDEGARVEERLNIVISNATTGLIIVLIVLLIFLPGSVGVMSALSLPIGVLATVGYMVMAGANFNIITMLGLIIALGMLVDNATVVAENYAAHRSEGLEPRDAAVQAGYQFWVPLTASTLTTVAAFIPMLVTKGVLGQFIQWIPITVCAALILSLLESFFLLPPRLSLILRSLSNGKPQNQGQLQAKKKDWFEPLQERFIRLMRVMIRRRYWTAFGMASLFVSGFLFTIFFNRFELFPAENVEFYIARLDAPVGTSVYAVDEMVNQVSQQVREALGPESAAYVVGRAGVQQTDPGDPLAKNGENVGMLTIVIPREQSRVLVQSEVLAKLRALPKPGGLDRLSFETVAGGPPVGKPLTVTFRSDNGEALRQFVDEITLETRKIEGAIDILDDENKGGPEYRLVWDQAKAAYVKLSIDGLGLSFRTALQGFIGAELSEGSTEYDLRIRLDDPHRQNISQLRGLEVLNSTGQMIRINQFSDFQKAEAPAVRKHYEFRRSITLTSDLDTNKISSQQLNSKVKALVEAAIPKYPDVSYRFGGEEETTQESFQSLLTALLLAFVGIFAILVFMFRSYSKPILVATSIPLGLVGVCYAFTLHQRPLSFIALIGVIGLAGVVVNSAIILIDYIEEMRKSPRNQGLATEEIIAQASGRRLRAVMVTSITTVAGLMPTAYGIGGYDPILVPMTLALAWGLAAGTGLTLLWVPCGYQILEDIRNIKLFSRRR